MTAPVEIDDDGVCLTYSRSEDLKGTHVSACAAHAAARSRRGIDDDQIRLDIAVGHEKNISFHRHQLQNTSNFSCAAIVIFGANLALR